MPGVGERNAPRALSAEGSGNDDVAGLRGYQPADSPRHVAWKAVARSDELLTTQFTGEAAAELWLDWRLLPSGSVEQRLSVLAGWVLAAERRGVRYGLRMPGVEIAPGRGDSHSGAALQALALYKAT